MTEAEAHEIVREALSNGLTNSNFYVSLKVTVDDPDAGTDQLDLDDLVPRANQWLDGLDPDGPLADRTSLRTDLGPVTINLSALPWKPEVRAAAQPGVVGPRYPVITE